MASPVIEPRLSAGGSAPKIKRGFGDAIYTEHFTDHAQNDSLSIWKGPAKPGGVPLRHPFNFQVYVTPGATASDESVEDNMQALYKRIQEFSSAEKRCWSFAVYFLPTSSLEEIISHYQAERAHRHASSWPIPHSYRNTLMNYNAFVLIVDDDIALFQADKQLENYPEVSTFSFEHQIPEWAKDDAEYEEPEQCVGRESVDSVGEWLDALCDNIWGQDRDMEFQDEVRKHLQEQGVDL